MLGYEGEGEALFPVIGLPFAGIGQRKATGMLNFFRATFAKATWSTSLAACVFPKIVAQRIKSGDAAPVTVERKQQIVGVSPPDASQVANRCRSNTLAIDSMANAFVYSAALARAATLASRPFWWRFFSIHTSTSAVAVLLSQSATSPGSTRMHLGLMRRTRRCPFAI